MGRTVSTSTSSRLHRPTTPSSPRSSAGSVPSSTGSTSGTRSRSTRSGGSATTPIEDATAPGGTDAILDHGLRLQCVNWELRSVPSRRSTQPATASGTRSSPTPAGWPPSKLILGVPSYGRAPRSKRAAAPSTRRTNEARQPGRLRHRGRLSQPDAGAAADTSEGCRLDCARTAPRRTAASRRGASCTWTTQPRCGQEVRPRQRLRTARGQDVGPRLRRDATRSMGDDGAQVSQPTRHHPSPGSGRSRPASPTRPSQWTWAGPRGATSPSSATTSRGPSTAVPGSNWILGTKAASGTGCRRAPYAFPVRARDPKGNVGPWNVISKSPAPPRRSRSAGSGSSGSQLSIRSAPGTTAPIVGQYASGDVVVLLAGPQSVDGYPGSRWRGR